TLWISLARGARATCHVVAGHVVVLSRSFGAPGSTLRYRMTINDHAAARDSHRRDDRGDQAGKGTRTGILAFTRTRRLPGASTSPLSFRKRFYVLCVFLLR